jgi:hypothetical protein
VGGTVTSDQADGEYDPLAVFQAMAAGPSSQELYGKFAGLRAECPVHPQAPPGAGGDGETAGAAGSGGVTVVPPWGPEPRFTTVTFQAAQAVLGNPDMSSAGYYDPGRDYRRARPAAQPALGPGRGSRAADPRASTPVA